MNESGLPIPTGRFILNETMTVYIERNRKDLILRIDEESSPVFITSCIHQSGEVWKAWCVLRKRELCFTLRKHRL